MIVLHYILNITERESSKKSDVGWIKTVLSSGTLGDKIAALTLLVQESPIQNLSSLESLINMSKKKGKRECMMAAGTKFIYIYCIDNGE